MEESKNGRFRKKRVNFSMVSNSIIRDGTISLRAKGLYSLIQSYITIENFVLYKHFLMSKCREGKKAFDAAWSELKQSGYLVQYRMQDKTTKQFYWEYELLDKIETEKAIPPKGGYGCQEPYPQKGYYGFGSASVRDSMENWDVNNNTKENNIIPNNINQIISLADVCKQIEWDYYDFSQKRQAKEIALLIMDIYNTPDDSIIRINGIDRMAIDVKERFRMLDHFHIIYVIESMKDAAETVRNKRNYLLTALYNAPTSLETSYQIEINNF